jgi:hypothetical protein
MLTPLQAGNASCRTVSDGSGGAKPARSTSNHGAAQRFPVPTIHRRRFESAQQTPQQRAKYA